MAISYRILSSQQDFGKKGDFNWLLAWLDQRHTRAGKWTIENGFLSRSTYLGILYCYFEPWQEKHLNCHSTQPVFKRSDILTMTDLTCTQSSLTYLEPAPASAEYAFDSRSLWFRMFSCLVPNNCATAMRNFYWGFTLNCWYSPLNIIESVSYMF